MPASKNATKRYLIIHRCLSSKGKKHWTIEELIRVLEENDILITARTLRYDLEAMRFDTVLGFNSPIKYCRFNKGYHYSDPSYSIESVRLTEEQLHALNFMVEVLRVDGTNPRSSRIEVRC
jgi:hypothetical protein